jgi:hypothetical protein
MNNHIENYNDIFNSLSNLLLNYYKELYFTVYQEIISILKNIKILSKMRLPININLLEFNDINEINDKLYKFKENFEKNNKYEFVNIYDKIYFTKITKKITLLKKLIKNKLNIDIDIPTNESLNITTHFIIDYIYNCIDKLVNDSTNDSTNIKIISKQYIDDLYESTSKLIQRNTIYNQCIFTNSSFLFQQYSTGTYYNLYFSYFMKRLFKNTYFNYNFADIMIYDTYITYELNLFNDIIKCNKRFICLSLRFPEHANSILIDKKLKNIYHFEPHGIDVISNNSDDIIFYLPMIISLVQNYEREIKDSIISTIIEHLLQNKLSISLNNDLFGLFIFKIFTTKHNKDIFREKVIKKFIETDIESYSLIFSQNIPNLNLDSCIILDISINYNSLLHHITSTLGFSYTDKIYFIVEKNNKHITLEMISSLNKDISNNTPKDYLSIYGNLYNLFKINLIDYKYYSPLSITTLPFPYYEPNLLYDPDGYCVTISYMYIISFLMSFEYSEDVDISSLYINFVNEYINSENNELYIRKMSNIIHQYIYKFIVYLFDNYKKIILSYSDNKKIIEQLEHRSYIFLSLRKHILQNYKISKALYEIINNSTEILLLARNIIYTKENDTIMIKFNVISSYDNLIRCITDKENKNFYNDDFSKNRDLFDITDLKWNFEPSGNDNTNLPNMPTIPYYQIDLFKEFDIIDTKSDSLDIDIQINIAKEYIKEYFRILLIHELHKNDLNNLLLYDWILEKDKSKIYKRTLKEP